MKKILSIIAMCFMLQGCFWQTADQFDIYRASSFCGGIENVAGLDIAAMGDGRVSCFDGRDSRLYLINPPAKIKP